MKALDHTVIFKYPLTNGYFEGEALGGPVVLAGRDGDGVTCVWIQGHTLSVRRFHVFGTGMPFPEGDFKHRGSFVAAPYVWHVYEEMQRG